MRWAHEGWVLVAAAAALPLAGQAPPARLAAARMDLSAPVAATGEIFGLVTDAGGRREAGAVVLVRGEGWHSPPLRRVTSAAGLFTVAGLKPGVYFVEVGKGERLAARQRVEVHASERALMLVNLPQLLQSVQFGAPPGSQPDQAFDWALRQATVWRPILRLDETNAGPPVEEDAAEAPVQGYVAFTAGAGTSALDSSDLATAFSVDSGLWEGERVALTGEVGTNSLGSPSDTRVQASFHAASADNPNRLMVAVRQVMLPGLSALPALRVVSFNYASALPLGDRLRLQYGAMVNAVTMTDTVTAFSPYVRASYQINPEATIEYRAASAVPPLRFGHDYAEMPDPTPQVTLNQNRARLEQARHQEIRYTDSLTSNDTVSGAVFEESFRGTAVNGAFSLAGSAPPAATAGSDANLLPDLFNNMFIANGGDYGGWGYRAVWDHHLGGDWHADLSFSEGPVLAPAPGDEPVTMGASGPNLTAVRAHAITAKVAGTTPFTHTYLACSYRALNRAVATGLDLYDDGPAQSDSYANLYVRQPLPRFVGGRAGRIAALIEIHNLLAQGYIPMLASDGRMLYLVQSARSLRGGLTFNF